jgi:hypothetical protein
MVGDATCQTCGYAPCESIIDLGIQPVCNRFLKSKTEFSGELRYPLHLVRCPKCDLVQLSSVPPADLVFGEDFNYLSGTTKEVVEHCEALAREVIERIQPDRDGYFVDIGSNDGTFLTAIRKYGFKSLGVEPGKKPADIAIAAGIDTIVSRFENASEEILRRTGGRISVVSALSVIAHTDSIDDFLVTLRRLLSGSGATFVCRIPYLPSLIAKREYDTIYHEHARYFSLTSQNRLFRKHHLFVYDARLDPLYGGSIVTFAKPFEQPPTDRASRILEDEAHLRSPTYYSEFARAVVSNRDKLREVLTQQKEKGKRIVGIGAPMKASTLLNYCAIGPELLDYVTEVNPLKLGTFTPGTHIPVVSEDVLLKDSPDCALILSWNAAPAITRKLRSMGVTARFLTPIPEPRWIE